jgi:PIN domain nuclease of toxin-antitoxin system
VIVLDASALMALINGEPGSEVVERAAAEDDTTISAINYSEALQKATRHGVAPEDVDAALDALGVTVSPFGRLDARLAASFYRHLPPPFGPEPGRPRLPCPRSQPGEPGLHDRPALAVLGRRPRREGHGHPLTSNTPAR